MAVVLLVLLFMVDPHLGSGHHFWNHVRAREGEGPAVADFIFSFHFSILHLPVGHGRPEVQVVAQGGNRVAQKVVVVDTGLALLVEGLNEEIVAVGIGTHRQHERAVAIHLRREGVGRAALIGHHGAFLQRPLPSATLHGAANERCHLGLVLGLPTLFQHLLHVEAAEACRAEPPHHVGGAVGLILQGVAGGEGFLGEQVLLVVDHSLGRGNVASGDALASLVEGQEAHEAEHLFAGIASLGRLLSAMPAMALADDAVRAVGEHQRHHAWANALEYHDAFLLQRQHHQARRLVVGIEFAALGQCAQHVVGQLRLSLGEPQRGMLRVAFRQGKQLVAPAVCGREEIVAPLNGNEREHRPARCCRHDLLQRVALFAREESLRLQRVAALGQAHGHLLHVVAYELSALGIEVARHARRSHCQRGRLGKDFQRDDRNGVVAEVAHHAGVGSQIADTLGCGGVYVHLGRKRAVLIGHQPLPHHHAVAAVEQFHVEIAAIGQQQLAGSLVACRGSMVGPYQLPRHPDRVVQAVAQSVGSEENLLRRQRLSHASCCQEQEKQ